MQSYVAWAKVAEYAARADEAFDENTRHLFLALRESWIRVARNWEDIEAQRQLDRQFVAAGPSLAPAEG